MNIGIIAHDAKKSLMQSLCVAYRGILSKHEIFSTGTSGRMIEEATNLNVHKAIAGHLGGEMQICSLIENNQLDAVIFLRDPNETRPQEQELLNIIELCDETPIPIATNLAFAEMLIHAIDRGDLDWRNAYK